MTITALIGGFVLAKGLSKSAEAMGAINLRPLLILSWPSQASRSAPNGSASLSHRYGPDYGKPCDQNRDGGNFHLNRCSFISRRALFVYGLGVQMPIWPF